MLGLEQNRIGEKGMEDAGRIVKQCSVKEINLSHCATSIKEAEAFGRCAKGADVGIFVPFLAKLDIRHHIH